MRRMPRLCTALFIIFLASCGQQSAPIIQSNPIPSLTSVSPSTVNAGSENLTLVVTGSSFVSGSVVQWNGQARTTSFSNNSQLSAIVTAADLAVAATVSVTVFTPSPGGGTSNAITVAINNPQPLIASVSPPALTAGSDASLTIFGSGFVANSVAKWNGAALPTSVVSNTKLNVSLSAANTAAAQLNSVLVANALPGGGASNPILVATNSTLRPSVAILVPASATAGASQLGLRVYGQNLSPNSIVQWNGAPRATRFVKPGLVIAAVSAADIAHIGTATVTAAIPESGTGTAAFAATATSVLPFAIQPSATPELLQRVSVAGDGSDRQGTIPDPTVATSIDGRYVAFASTAELTPDVRPGGYLEVFVRDTCAGVAFNCSPTTVLASIGIPGSVRPSGGEWPSITADGRYVTFDGADLDPTETIEQANVYLRDTCTNALDPCTPSTSRVSVASDGSEANAMSHSAKLTPDGRYLVFDSDASNLVAGDTNGVTDAFVRDTCLGAPGGCAPSTIRISLANDGSEPNDRSGSWSNGGSTAISDDGRFVAFPSLATNLTTLSGPTPAVFVRDTVQSTTIRASVANDGTPLTGVGLVSLSGDGRYVAFTSGDSRSCQSPTGSCSQVFVRDTCNNASTACSPSTALISVSTDGQPANGRSASPAIGTDGRFVAFLSDAPNLVTTATNGFWSLFIRDTCVGAPVPCTPSTVLLSVRGDGTQLPNYVSPGPPANAISAYGRFVAFPGPAELLPGKTLGGDDVFLAISPF